MPVTNVSANGDSVILQLDTGERVYCAPDGRGMWLPTWWPEPPAPDPDPEDPPVDPEDPPVDPGTGEWVHPLPGATITSGFGPRDFDGFHYGLDFSTGTGTSGQLIKAITDMKITVATDHGEPTAGTYVKGHSTDNKYTFAFYHMVTGSLEVSVGQTVAKGATIGREGATGNVTGLHLHLEMFNGAINDPWYTSHTAIDPLPILRANGINI